ncbi:hypothetical protein DPEC_G00331880 [Dallia pectoralis]|uniref:Uncharacterized protein n=1 Tax=Dallia pectoralis TaxID=75939 RepID=A0ACC2F6B5_DALPE|nr:hypothetical protein DPEC_G00331880 [Dallia pectoralis]
MAAAPQLKVAAAPQLKMAAAPQHKMAAAPQLKMAAAPQLKMAAAPQLKMAAAPQLKMAAAPQHKMAAAPQHKMAAAPQHEMAAAPQHEMAAAPQHEMAAAPQHEMAAAPQHEMAAAPQHEMAAAPQHEMAAAPQQRMAAAPQQKMAAAPQQKMAAAPSTKMAAARGIEEALREDREVFRDYRAWIDETGCGPEEESGLVSRFFSWRAHQGVLPHPALSNPTPGLGVLRSVSSTGLICAQLVPQVFLKGAVEDGKDCTKNHGLLKEISEDLISPSECMLSCTRLTYRLFLETLDRRNIRFKDSEAGRHEEYCWSTKSMYFPENHLFHSYIVLPVNESLVNGELIGLKASPPHHNDIITPYKGPTPLSNLCGFLFDVTGHFTMTKRWPRFCMNVVSKQSIMGNGVLNRCQPFLALIWEN